MVAGGDSSISGPSPSIQSLSAIQPGSGGPHNRKNNSAKEVMKLTIVDCYHVYSWYLFQVYIILWWF